MCQPVFQLYRQLGCACCKSRSAAVEKITRHLPCAVLPDQVSNDLCCLQATPAQNFHMLPTSTSKSCTELALLPMHAVMMDRVWQEIADEPACAYLPMQ